MTRDARLPSAADDRRIEPLEARVETLERGARDEFLRQLFQHCSCFAGQPLALDATAS